ncbi:MAG TPA: DUF1294 domain-containing protein [Candidatus Pullichristensenella avicola]|nr:DUF1294 domain-containing protein [Candidatus Pullichristensenella avicola]
MLLLGAMAVMSLIAFCAMGLDKFKARRGAWRIPEKSLFALAFLLGAPGAYAGMMVFRHKTLHRRFAVGLPLLSAAEIIFVLWALFAR